MSYGEVGHDTPGEDYDDWAADAGAGPLSLNTDALIETTQSSAQVGSDYHASMAEAWAMPRNADGTGLPAVVRTETHLLHLFDGYLEGVCSL